MNGLHLRRSTHPNTKSRPSLTGMDGDSFGRRAHTAQILSEFILEFHPCSHGTVSHNGLACQSLICPLLSGINLVIIHKCSRSASSWAGRRTVDHRRRLERDRARRSGDRGSADLSAAGGERPRQSQHRQLRRRRCAMVHSRAATSPASTLQQRPLRRLIRRRRARERAAYGQTRRAASG